MEQNNHQHEELVLQYLREFRKYGEMLDSERFNEVVAEHLGLTPESSEFLSIQSRAEEMIHEELQSWMQERAASAAAALEPTNEELAPSPVENKFHEPYAVPGDTGEDVQYISVDYTDMEDEFSLEDDLCIAGQQLDIQVFHFGDEKN